jgi:hypothetical protein
MVKDVKKFNGNKYFDMEGVLSFSGCMAGAFSRQYVDESLVMQNLHLFCQKKDKSQNFQGSDASTKDKPRKTHGFSSQHL